MTIALRVAARLIRRGQGLRAWAMVLAAAISTTVMALALSLPDAVLRPDARYAERATALTAMLFALLPIATLLLCVSRLSSATRLRRLAALRLIGADVRSTRTIAALEVGVSSFAGSLAGAATARLVAPFLSSSLERAGLLHSPFALTIPAVVAALIAVPIMSIVVSVGAVQSLTRTALAVRRGAPARMTATRLVPLLVGLAIAAVMTVYRSQTSGLSFVMFCISMGGIALAAIGSVIAIPYLTALAASRLSASGRPALKLAGRRMEIDPAASSRVVSGVAISLLLATAAVGVVDALQGMPTYRWQERSLASGPQVHQLYSPSSDAVLRDPQVIEVVPSYPLLVTCGGQACGQALVATCDQLRELARDVTNCSDDGARWITHQGAAPGFTTATAVVAHEQGGRQARVAVPGTVDLPNYHPMTTPALSQSLFIPTPMAKRLGLAASPTSFFVVTGPGRGVAEQVMARTGVELTPEPLTTFDRVNAWRLVTWSLLGFIVLVGVLTLSLTALDRAVERRRELASQIALGVPRQVLVGAQTLQTILPTALALVVAIPTGLLGAYAFTRDVPDMGVATWATLMHVLGPAALAIAVASSVSLVAIPRRLTADLLRTE